MTGHDHDPEDLLRDAFRDRVDDTEYAATRMSDVMSTARAIRRRRRTTATALAAAAVVAVTLPVAVVAHRELGASPTPPVADRSTSPGPSIAVLGPPDGPPQIGYAASGVYHRPDGSTVDLPEGALTSVTALGLRLLVTDDPGTSGPLTLTELDNSGDTRDESCTTSVPATSGRSVFAWTTRPCAGGAATIFVAGSRDILRSQEVAGDPVLVGVDASGGVVYVDVRDGGVYVSQPDDEPRTVPRLQSAAGYDTVNGLIAGQLDDTTGAVVERDGTVVWSRQGMFLGRFSPDGRFVVAGGTSGGDPSYVLDAFDGRILAEIDGSGPDDFPTMGGLVWEDDTHLLALMMTNSSTYLVRVDLNGATTMLPEPEPLFIGDGELILETRP